MKRFAIACMTLVLVGLALMSTGCDDFDKKVEDGKVHTIIIPGVVKCRGHIEPEYLGATYRASKPMLVCDDGRVFHNITNYQDIVELNPLCRQ